MEGLIPVNDSVNILAIVTAGFAKPKKASSILIILTFKPGIELIVTKNIRAATDIASYLYLFQINLLEDLI